MSKELAVYEQTPLTAADIKGQVGLIQDVMRQVMRENEHYGKIPGCGDKPTLLQPGAQKLIMTFRLVPDAEVEVVALPRDHREYRVKVKMYTQSGVFLGAGVGSCSTMEGKYRYRTGPTELTENPVPKEYWDLRKEDPVKALAMIGGKGHTTKKNEVGQWVVAIQGDKVEHDNPADYYNTCEKMAFKRALVSATLTVTAASDIFTQDIEEMVENGVITPKTEVKTAPKAEAAHVAAQGDGHILTGISKIDPRRGKGPYRIFDAAGTAYNTFSDSIAADAQKAKDSGQKIRIEFKKTQYGLDIVEVISVEDVDAEEIPFN